MDRNRDLSRCQPGDPCEEVAARERAARRAADAWNVPPDHPAVLRLLDAADRWREAHGDIANSPAP
jgi:hypothetical protein